MTHVTGVTLDVTSKTMVVGETFTLTPTIAPADATDKTYSWSTSDGSVATISDGLVTAVGVGTADITVTTTDGSFTATCAVTVEAPDPLSGTYKIGGAEADFATLYSAVDYLNHWGISGNTTFLICDDLTETHNIGFVNSSAYTITIKPDADVDRTISFTQVADNTGPSGALVIGSNAADIGWAATATRNIVIDGLASAGATHKMTIKTPSTFGATAGPIVIYGSVTNTIIRNCRIINELSPTAMCITLRNNQPTGSASTSDDYPDGVIIENNYIATPNANNGQGIYINGSKATTTGPSNTVIRNNEINASSRGVFLYGLNSITIDNNTFRMNSASGYDCAAIYGLTSAGNINIRNNKILSLTSNNTSETTAHGLNGIIAGSGGNWLIENNLITGFDATSDGRKGHLIGIKTGGTPSSIKILHNTFYMPAFSHTMTSTLLSAKPVTLLYIAGGTPIVKNNIFISQETSCVNSLIRGALNANCTSNVFYSAGGNGVIVDGANACANWDELCSKYSAQALTSTCQLVEFTENYKPTSAYVDNANLAVTPLAEVTTDIEGTTRNATKTYAGCYEASNIALVYSGVSSLTLPATASIERGNTLELTPTVSPAIAINRTQFWNSDNTAVATVDNSGVVTAVAVGTAHITVTVDGVTSDACTVTVYRTDFDVTWVPNGATTTSVAPASNNDLWTQFMTDYNTYYGLSRGIQTIDHVRWFLNNVNCIDFITNPESPWCWLGKIILPAAEAAGRTLDTEVKCSFDIQAFFNQLPAESGEYGYGDYTIAGQIENWLPLWKEANNYLPPTMSATDEMPVIRKGNDLLAGWYDNSSFTGAPVTSVTADMTLYAKWIAPIELDEASADNIAKIEANDGELANVILRRTFEATGYWYTLVLPFDVSAEQMEETFGAGYEVTVLESSYRKSETAIYLKFVPQTYIKAGEPCLFKPGRDIDEAIFRSVTIDNTTPEVNTTIVNMVGLYAPTDVTLSDNNYYLGSTNYLHEYVAIYQNTKGFRAYFHFNEAMAAGCSARVVFREDTATELEDLPEVNTPSVQKVIRDGQLIIIREGKEYTTQGQLIQ
ncbi:MAG: Ig-like domain-containing protein [Paludibacteraceae bacterium]|nr:Ig-like domain-containing protein [Paludibacteraceae bacterium]